ncbi:hypothetical protein [Pelagibacterium xiamenense]|uniref:hypothetical protein n=1 Tax=Pelagibacterium xiamenense TaxID=2901140 RepID=UPI001E4DAF30|nr:hypothetical protein [Pelagibacterium xiamenense]MCD7058460.1 hypothetical protein [Pelagibacterium xiamenense]
MHPLLRRLGAVGFFGLALTGPALAQDAPAEALPAEADKLLWCASAVHFLGIATADETEADTYFTASQMLLEKAAATLIAAEIPADDVAGIVATYDERVVSDFESDADLPYDPGACLDALELG